METVQWGRQEVLKLHEACKVKELIINPGRCITSHLHKKHGDHWIITKGKARVTIGSDTHVIQTNQHMYIPTGVKHKIENYSNDILILIEVQVGKYFGDDDIFN